MQVITICNLSLYFTAIVSTAFSPLQVFELVHDSVLLEFPHQFVFWLDYSLTYLQTASEKNKEQQNVIFTKRLFTLFAKDIWEKLL